jgi:hypothetical protein
MKRRRLSLIIIITMAIVLTYCQDNMKILWDNGPQIATAPGVDIPDIDIPDVDIPECNLSICPSSTTVTLGDSTSLDIMGVDQNSKWINWKIKSSPGGATWAPPEKNAIIQKFTPSALGTYNMEVSYNLFGQSCSCDFQVYVEKETTGLTMSQCFNGGGTGREILIITADFEYFDGPINVMDTLNYIKNRTGIKVSHMSLLNISNIKDKLESNQHDAVWIFSSFNSINNSDAQQLGSLFRQAAEKGVGLAFFGDNDPFNVTVNQLLGKSFPEWGLKLSGDYMGTNFVSKSGPGKIFEHSITSRLGLSSKVFEGVTISIISTPASSISSSFFPILQNSGNTGLSIGAIEYNLPVPSIAKPNAAVKNGKPQLRAILHGGVTSLMKTPMVTNLYDTHEFYANIACWNVGANDD